MIKFEDLDIPKPLQLAIEELGFSNPTPIQVQALPVILSGKDVVGIAQTGTGKTLAYILPILQQLKFSKQLTPRVLIMVPTRELVMQMVESIKNYAKYMNVRVLGVFGEANINTQKQAIASGVDILVATPGRLYDLALSRSLQLKEINKLIIDEVDVMLDLGFRPQLINIFDLLPTRRQNIMFSATMTADVDAFINDFFVAPSRISIAVSGTPLENISQVAYPVKNFYTKVNLLTDLLSSNADFKKVLVFVSQKKIADHLFMCLEGTLASHTNIIHSNKSQNYRIRAVQEFEIGEKQVLVATDVISRGLDLNKVSHVISFDTPEYPENYMHRIGRTGRAKLQGKSILFFTPQEEVAKEAIERLMDYKIPVIDFPEWVAIRNELTPEEKPKTINKNYLPGVKRTTSGSAFHEKLEKNKKVNEGGSYRKKIAAKYKKPKTRGDKYNKRNK